jgi:hypothetical protein
VTTIQSLSYKHLYRISRSGPVQAIASPLFMADFEFVQALLKNQWVASYWGKAD